MIKDLFYSTRKGIYDIFNEAKLGNSVDLEGLKTVVMTYSHGHVNEGDIEAVFKHVSRGRDHISY